MTTTVTSGDETDARAHRSLILERVSLGGLYALLLWAPLAFGAHEGWPLAIAELLALLAFSSWLLSMIIGQRFEWRRTSLDPPLGLLIAFVLLQLVLSNRALL